jgi:hypothetical protein
MVGNDPALLKIGPLRNGRTEGRLCYFRPLLIRAGIEVLLRITLNNDPFEEQIRIRLPQIAVPIV